MANLLRLGGNNNDRPRPRMDDLDDLVTQRWHVKKVLLCRDKGSTGTDLVKYIKETGCRTGQGVVRPGDRV